VDRLEFDNRGIKERRNLAVLKYTSMPAILVECAFISNPEERELLETKKFRNKAAGSIFDGINKYFKGG